MVGVGGVIVSILVFAVGAILDWAVTVSTSDHGFDIHTVGIILMIAGAVGFVLALALLAVSNTTSPRRHETTIEDGRGHVMHREDRYTT